MFNPESLRKQLSFLSDEALLESCVGDLTDLAKPVYEAELAERGLTWPSDETDSAPTSNASGFPDPTDAELVHIARFETFGEARLAIALLRQEDIPVWLAGATGPGQTMVDPNAPIDIVTHAEFLEAAQLLLSSEISDEELARMAEEAGEKA